MTMVDDSSATEATTDLDKTSTELGDRSHSYSHGPKPNDNKKTGANIMPDTSEETHDLDIEKAAQDEKPKPPGAFDPSSFPDGGLEAWLVVSGAFCCLFSSFGWINAIGVFQTYYEKGPLSQYSASTVSWIPAFEVFMMFLGGPVWGKLYDNHGPRYLLAVGTFLHVFGLMMASLSTKYYQFFLSQGVCSAIGASLLFYPAMSATGTWFFRKRAFAFGVMVAGSSLGGVIFPIMIERLIVERGFAWAMRAAAFLILGLLIYANLTVKSRLPPTPRPWALMDFVKPFTEVPYFLTVFGAFLFFFGMFLPFTFIILSAQYHGMSANLSGYLVAILNAASVLGRTLPGWVADKVGRYNTMVFVSFLSTIFVLALWLPAQGNVPYILFAAFFGFSSGAFVSLIPALIAQISDVRQIGVRSGSMFAAISVAALVGNPIGGALVSHENGQYLHLQIFCGVTMFAGSCVFVAARYSLEGPDARKNI